MPDILHSLPNEHSAEMLVWPDGAPTVSIDITAGKKYSEVNVNPFELNRELDLLGISDEDRSKVSIELKDSTIRSTDLSNSLSVGMNGRYRSNGSNGGSVQLALARSDDHLNKTLTHELAHFRQDLEGTLDTLESINERRPKYIKAALGAVATIGTVGLAITNSGIGESLPNHIKLLVNAGTLASIPTLGIFGGSAIEYRQRPTEIEARETANDQVFAHNTISTVKK